MVHKTYFALAVVFLAVAVATPIVVLGTQPDGFGIIINQNPWGMVTEGNVSLPIPDEAQQPQFGTTLIILAVVEVVFVLLFVVSLYYGLKTHPMPKSDQTA